MGRKKTLHDCYTHDDFCSVVSREGGQIGRGGRHDVAQRADGTGRVPLPRHAGQYARGTRKSIIAALTALGFFAATIGCLVVEMMR